MPLPKPKKNEKKTEFIKRFMSSKTAKEFDKDQRLAIAYSTWKERK